MNLCDGTQFPHGTKHLIDLDTQSVSSWKYTFLNVKKFLNKLILLFSKDALKWSKVTVKILILLQRISILNSVLLNFLFYQGILKYWKKCIIVLTKILSSTAVFNIIINMRNVTWAAHQHINMISEGSCDTEDWSNDTENSALRHRNKLYFKR